MPFEGRVSTELIGTSITLGGVYSFLPSHPLDDSLISRIIV